MFHLEFDVSLWAYGRKGDNLLTEQGRLFSALGRLIMRLLRAALFRRSGLLLSHGFLLAGYWLQARCSMQIGLHDIGAELDGGPVGSSDPIKLGSTKS